ncbi:hypothetical protein SYNPS1DRAFT_18066, partial [Syncephalis pseudoplumigaleata]
LQFAWWIGHVTVVVSTVLYYLCYLTNYYTMSLPAYSFALMGALASYAVASYKSMGKLQFNMQFAAQVASNDSMQYLLLAFVWYTQPALLVTLVPFAVFSALHTLTYFHGTVVPVLFPAATSATPSDAKPYLARLSASADMAARKYYMTAMHFVARWEVAVVLAWTILQTVLFQVSFYVPFAYMMFLRNRYICSSYHQEAFRHLRRTMDRHLVDNPNAHTGIRRLYVSTRDFISSLAGPLHMPHPPAQ